MLRNFEASSTSRTYFTANFYIEKKIIRTLDIDFLTKDG